MEYLRDLLIRNYRLETNLYILEIHVTLHLLSQFFPLNPCAQTHLKRFGPWLRQVAPFRHGLESHTDTIAVAEKKGRGVNSLFNSRTRLFGKHNKQLLGLCS